MKQIRTILLTGLLVFLAGSSLSARQISLPQLYDESALKEQFDAFMEELDPLLISRKYPGAVRKLLSGDEQKQLEAIKTLAATQEIEAVPWLLPFLDVENKGLRMWTGASLEKIVSAYVLQRRDSRRPETVLIRPLQPQDKDLRPLAWIVLKMFRRPDDGNTHAYAATMARYLGLYAFERELVQCLESRHPAVVHKAQWALDSLEQQRAYEQKATGGHPDTAQSQNVHTILIVLGNEPLDDQTPTVDTIARVEKAVAYVKEQPDSLILFTGGITAGQRSEAQMMADMAVQQGLPKGAVLIEEQARSTSQNAYFAATLLKDYSWQKILIVSKKEHLEWAMPIFNKLEIFKTAEALPCEVRYTDSIAQMQAYLKMHPQNTRVRKRLQDLLQGRKGTD